MRTRGAHDTLERVTTLGCHVSDSDFRVLIIPCVAKCASAVEKIFTRCDINPTFVGVLCGYVMCCVIFVCGYVLCVAVDALFIV